MRALWDEHGWRCSRRCRKTVKVSVSDNITVDLDGFKFFIKPSPSATSIFLAKGSCEDAETEFVKNKIRPETLFLILARILDGIRSILPMGSQGFSFEPIPSTYHELRENVALNQYANVEATNKAVGAKNGSVEFFLPKTFGGSAIASEHNYFGDQLRSKMTTLDAYVEEQGIRPNFIKADIEGGELGMLQGGDKKTLTRFHPDLFMEIEERHTERFGYKPEDIFSFLEKLGYRRTQVGPIMFYFSL